MSGGINVSDGVMSVSAARRLSQHRCPDTMDGKETVRTDVL